MGVTDIAAESITVPIIPNRPLMSADEAESFGHVALRRNAVTGLIDNAAFDPDLIHYDADYQNNQAVSPLFAQHMQQVRNLLKARYPAGTAVVEVGCGKGEFVELLQSDGYFEVRGYDGAYEGSNPGIEKRFLTADDKLHADLVVLRHVLEHIQRPHEFLSLLSGIFADAEIYIEVPDFAWIEKNQAFFDITYEHVNYFTPQSLARLFKSVEQHGLLFGDQYQFVIGSFGEADFPVYGRAHEVPDNWTPVSFDETFPAFTSVVDDISNQSDGKPIYVWGAATKGVMFCHHMKRMHPIAFERIEAAIDINPKKAGRFMPSVHLPILSVDDFCNRACHDALVIIMNPNYRDEIVAELNDRGFSDIRYISV
ncbi:MAG TPA: class I SAM-dependent methyltransferase [Woeseiaceae bacterium]|nr:class I SAM-dependent methyltransferase [Woeseiaceae bacterium]